MDQCLITHRSAANIHMTSGYKITIQKSHRILIISISRRVDHWNHDGDHRDNP